MLRLPSDRSLKQLLAEPYSTVDVALSLSKRTELHLGWENIKQEL